MMTQLVSFSILYIFLVYALISLSKKMLGGYIYILIILFFFGSIGTLQYLLFGPFRIFGDSIYYEKIALKIIDWWATLGPNPFAENLWQNLMDKRAWPATMAFIYSIFGEEALYIIFLQVFLIAATAFFVAISIQKLNVGFKPGPLFIIVFSLAPFFTIWGTSIGREAIFWSGISIITYSSYLLIKSQYKKGYIIFVISAILIVTIRPNLGLPIIFSFVIPLFIYLVWLKKPNNLFEVLKYSFLSLFIFLSAILSYFLIQVPSTDFEENRESFTNDPASGFTPLLNDEISQIENPVLELLALSLSNFPNTFFGPFPHEWSLNSRMIFAEVTLIYWLIILILVLWGIHKNWERRLGVTFLVIATIILLVVSTTLTSYALVARFKAISIVVLMPYAFFVFFEIIKGFQSKNELNSIRINDSNN